MPTTCKLVYSTFPSIEKAKAISKSALSEGHIKCANIIPEIHSIYEWEGKIKEDTECNVIFKTTDDKVDTFKIWLMEHHPYDVPAILVFSCETTKAFLSYLASK